MSRVQSRLPQVFGNRRNKKKAPFLPNPAKPAATNAFDPGQVPSAPSAPTGRPPSPTRQSAPQQQPTIVDLFNSAANAQRSRATGYQLTPSTFTDPRLVGSNTPADLAASTSLYGGLQPGYGRADVQPHQQNASGVEQRVPHVAGYAPPVQPQQPMSDQQAYQVAFHGAPSPTPTPVTQHAQNMGYRDLLSMYATKGRLTAAARANPTEPADAPPMPQLVTGPVSHYRAPQQPHAQEQSNPFAVAPELEARQREIAESLPSLRGRFGSNDDEPNVLQQYAMQRRADAREIHADTNLRRAMQIAASDGQPVPFDMPALAQVTADDRSRASAAQLRNQRLHERRQVDAQRRALGLPAAQARSRNRKARIANRKAIEAQNSIPMSAYQLALLARNPKLAASLTQEQIRARTAQQEADRQSIFALMGMNAQQAQSQAEIQARRDLLAQQGQIDLARDQQRQQFDLEQIDRANAAQDAAEQKAAASIPAAPDIGTIISRMDQMVADDVDPRVGMQQLKNEFPGADALIQTATNRGNVGTAWFPSFISDTDYKRFRHFGPLFPGHAPWGRKSRLTPKAGVTMPSGF